MASGAKLSSCGFNGGYGEHGPIVAKGTSSFGKEFDICDIHVVKYQNALNGIDYKVRLNYARDISSDKAVARRKQLTIGLSGFLRSEHVEDREDLL